VRLAICPRLQVEKYFGSLLPITIYWHGASRAAVGSDYALTDGTQILQVGALGRCLHAAAAAAAAASLFSASGSMGMQASKAHALQPAATHQ
jgi:hypothetical protein